MKKVQQTEWYEEWNRGDTATFTVLVVVLPLVAVATILLVTGQAKSFVEMMGSFFVWIRS